MNNLTDREQKMLEEILWHCGNRGNNWYANEVRKMVYLGDLQEERMLRKTFFSTCKKLIRESTNNVEGS